MTPLIGQARSDVEWVRRYADQLREQNRPEDFPRMGFTWDAENRPTAWRYYNGFMIDAFLRLGGEENVRYAEAFYSELIRQDGSVSDYLSGYLDSVEPARPLFRLLASSAAPDRYRKAIQWVYSQLENQRTYPVCGNNYLHHQDENRKPAKNASSYPIFLDGLYMTQPFLVECAAAIRTGTLRLTDKKGREIAADTLETEIVNRYIWIHAYLFNRETGLYQHGWNPVSATANGHYWGRGIGWLAMSMADVIGLLPESASRERLKEILLQLLDGMLRYQDASAGMWYNVVDKGPELPGNIPETSVTCMMAYTLVKVWNDGYAAGDHYLLKGLQALHGVLASKAFILDGQLHVRDTYLKSGVGESDAYYCKEGYAVDEAKGVAALLMAAAETERAISAWAVE